MLPVLFGAAALGALALTSRHEESIDDSSYGTVTLWMGGRGTRAGAGVASHLGGRSTQPYQWDVPSSVVSNWNTGDVFGFVIPFFNIPVGPQSRLESLNSRIEKARAKISDLEKQAASAKNDPSAMDRIVSRIASLETQIEKWQDTRDKVEMRMGAMYGSEVSLDPDKNVQTIEYLADRVIDTARKLRRRPDSKRARALMLEMVSSYDAMSGVIAALRSQTLGSPSPLPAMEPGLSGSMYSSQFQAFGSDDEDPRNLDASTSADRARQAAEEYRKARSEHPDLADETEDIVMDWRVRLGERFADKLRHQSASVYGALAFDDPDDEDFGFLGLGKKSREKRLRRRYERLKKKMEAAPDGSPKRERLERRLERVEGRMEKHDIDPDDDSGDEFGLVFEDFEYGLLGDDLVSAGEQYGFFFLPLMAAGVARAAGAKDRRATSVNRKKSTWGRYEREIRRALEDGNQAKAHRLRQKQIKLEKKMGSSLVSEAREDSEQYRFGVLDEFDQADMTLEDVPLFL